MEAAFINNFNHIVSRFLFLISLLSSSFTVQSQNLQDIKYITEPFPLYNYSEDGQVRGITVDILLAAAKEAGQEIKLNSIKIKPWARGYQETLKGPMTMIFGIARTQDREKEFKWVGPILETKISVFAKKSSAINIHSKIDFKKYEIGVVRDDLGEQLIRALGNDNNVQVSVDHASVLKKINFGRVELWVCNELVANKLIDGAGYLREGYEIIYVLDKFITYFAFSKDVPNDIVNTLQLGLDRLKEKNFGRDYEALIKK